MNDNSENKHREVSDMKIKEIGEKGIIEIFQTRFQGFSFDMSNVLLGIQTATGIHEDCAVIDLRNDLFLVITTDLIGARTHKPPGMNDYQFGKKAITVNVSDLAAMGARPTCLVMSVGFPEEFDSRIVEEIAEGMADACRSYQVPVVGGDVNSTDDIILAGTAIGLVPADQLLTRHSARTGDLVAVTGTLGDPALYLKILLEKHSISNENRQALAKRLFEPEARIKVGKDLAEAKILTSCADITDGLGWELHKIAVASKIGILVEEEKIPTSDAFKQICKLQRIQQLPLILYVGEDFELLMTIPPEHLEDAKKICSTRGIPLTVIGSVKGEPGEVLIKKIDGNIEPVKKKGYDQFVESKENKKQG
ncbi:MAG: thiamine-phosphate kinase [Candidatus Helarchaeota archaeon]